MADVVRYKLFLNNNKTIVEIFQREVGKTQRYMYIPADLTSKADAQTICDIITNGGNIANACVYDIINGGNTYYFTWKVKESLKRAEAIVFEDVQDFLRRSTKATPTISSTPTASVTPTTNVTLRRGQKFTKNPFSFKEGDNFENTTLGDKYIIKDIILGFDSYVVEDKNTGQRSEIKREIFEEEVTTGKLKLIQPTNFKFEIGDTIEDVSTNKLWKIIDIVQGFEQYVLQHNNNSPINMNRKGIEDGVESGIYKLTKAGQANQNVTFSSNKLSKQSILEELQNTELGDVIKIIRTNDGTLYSTIEVVGTTIISQNVWYVSGFQNGGTNANYYQDYFGDFLETNRYEIQIIKKALLQTTQAQPLKVGDKVKIAKSSPYYIDGDEYNPKDTIGTIITFEKIGIRVTWDNLTNNTYGEEDLEIVKQGQQAQAKVISGVKLPVVCLRSGFRKFGYINDVNGEIDSFTGVRRWKVDFDDGTHALCYRIEFFVQGDILDLTISSRNIDSTILVKEITDIEISYYFQKKSSGGGWSSYLSKALIPNILDFEITVVDPIDDIASVAALNPDLNQQQAKPKIYAVDILNKEIIEIIGISKIDNVDKGNEVWDFLDKKNTLHESYRKQFFVVGDVIEATSLTTPVNTLTVKVVDINNVTNEVSYKKYDPVIREFEDKIKTMSVEKVLQTPIKVAEFFNLIELFEQPDLIQQQAKPTIYGVDLGSKLIIEIISLDSKYSELKKDIWNLKDPNETYDTTRENFFVVGDIVKFTLKKDKTVWVNNKITEISNINDFIHWYNLDENSYNSVGLYDLFNNYNVEIIEYYNLREVFDQPVLVPQQDGSATPLTPSISVIDEIDQAKKDLGQLLFMRNLLSPIDFEQKIEVTQLIDEKQKLINELNFKGIEEKMAKDQFFDDLFEQSFTTIQHQYEDIYNITNQEIDFFTPNGARTQLSFEINEIIRTPQFKEWFGDWELAYIYKDADALELDCSKVLTANFEPRVVWHGTGKEFSYFIFDNFPAAYFAVNREYSQFFADLQGGGDGYVIPFFLNIRNPLDLTHFNTNMISSKDFFDYMYLMTGLTMEQLDVNPIFLTGSTPLLETWMYIRNNPKMLKKIAETKIYDGIHFYETNPNVTDVTSPAHKTEAYITFSADQCKIADPNRGMLLFASLKSFLLEKGGKI